MKTFFDIKKDFKNKRISKKNYIIKMHEYHQILFDYSKLITTTDINKIEISANQVVMESKQNNIKIICDSKDQRIAPIEILNFESYEGEYFDFFQKIAGQIKTFIDIGANIGWYSLNVAKINPQIKVYAFEPILKTYHLLVKNIEINQLNNITAMNLGLSNVCKKVKFYYDESGSGNASIMNLSKKRKQKQILCTVNTLDNIVKKQNIKVDLIKCDVEGNELNVFKGAIKTLTDQKPIVFTEMLRKWTRAFKYHPNEIIRLFNDLNYICFKLKNKKIIKVKTITEKTTDTNFIFFHNHQHKKYILKYC